jgi:hypothetical protein
MTRLVSNGPVRKLRMSNRALTGKVSLQSGRPAGFESSLERDWLQCLNLMPGIQTIQVQPFTLRYEWEGKSRPYTPDILASWTLNGMPETVVYEVKYREALRQNWQDFRPRFKAAVRTGREEGWKFRIVTEVEIRTPFLTNARFLKRFLILPADERCTFELMCMLKTLGDCTVLDLLRAGYWHEDDRAKALPYLWHLIATKQIRADLIEPLSLHSEIWLEA